MDQSGNLSEVSLFITRQFLAGVPLKDIHIKIQDTQWRAMDKSFQHELLKSTILNPIITKYPILNDYKINFLKNLISQLDSNRVDVLEEMYEELARLIQIKSSLQEYCNRIYCLNSGLHIVLREATSLISHGTTGLVTWQAAKVLTEWCLENMQQFTQKHVLELGCGLGLTGIAVCKSCSLLSYTFSDYHPKVLELLKHNLRVNFFESGDDGQLHDCNEDISVDEFEWNSLKIKVAPFHWDDDISMNELHHSLTADIILAADVIYDIDAVHYLIKVLKFFLQRPTCKSEQKSAVAYIASTIRNPATFEAFCSEAEMNGLKYEQLPFSMNTFFYDASSQFQVLKVFCR